MRPLPEGVNWARLAARVAQHKRHCSSTRHANGHGLCFLAAGHLGQCYHPIYGRWEKPITMDKTTLMVVRRTLIQLLNALDDALDLPRTIPSKSQRRMERKKQELQLNEN